MAQLFSEYLKRYLRAQAEWSCNLSLITWKWRFTKHRRWLLWWWNVNGIYLYENWSRGRERDKREWDEAWEMTFVNVSLIIPPHVDNIERKRLSSINASLQWQLKFIKLLVNWKIPYVNVRPVLILSLSLSHTLSLLLIFPSHESHIPWTPKHVHWIHV